MMPQPVAAAEKDACAAQQGNTASCPPSPPSSPELVCKSRAAEAVCLPQALQLGASCPEPDGLAAASLAASNRQLEQAGTQHLGSAPI